MTFEEALRLFLQSRSAKNNSPKTIDWYRDQIGRFHDWLVGRGVNGATWLQPEVIEAFLDAERQRGMKPGTVNARYRALLAFFNWLKKRGYLGDSPNPVKAVERPFVPDGDQDYVRLEEMRRLVASIPGESWTDLRDQAILLVLFWSGLRVNELCDMEVSSIDTRTLLITVYRGKGGKTRIVPCSPDLPQVLLAYLFERPPWLGPALWLSNDGAGGVRGALTTEGVRQMLIRRCAEAEMRYLHPHAWRHGFAMTFLNAGAEMSSISNMMGHSSTVMTESIYAKWLTDGLSAEYSRVFARLDGD